MDEVSRKFGRYTLSKLLARGGMGEIYLAQLVGVAGFEKSCVIKKIRADLGRDDAFVERFLNEGRTLVALTHSNIVQIFDMGEENGEYFLAMEYVQGADLRQILRCHKSGKVDVEIAAAVIREVLKGLSYAHRACDKDGVALGIVHRDISPSNILVSDEGEIKIIDFGIAKARTIESCSGLVQGKFAYMSPEQARGEHLDLRTDLFSLGIVFYEMLTGIRPFEGNSDLQSLEKIKYDTPQPVGELIGNPDAELEHIIERALSKSLEDRYQSADEFYDDVMAYSSSHGFHTGPREISAYFREWMAAEPVARTMDEALNAMLDAQVFAFQTTATQTLSPVPGGQPETPSALISGMTPSNPGAVQKTSNSSNRRITPAAISEISQSGLRARVESNPGLSQRSSNSSNRRVSPELEKEVIEAESEDFAALDESVIAGMDVEILRKRRRRRAWIRIRAGFIGGLIAIVLFIGFMLIFWHVNSRERAETVREALRDIRSDNTVQRVNHGKIGSGNGNWNAGMQIYNLSRTIQKGIPLLIETSPENATVYIVEGVYRSIDEKRMVLVPERDVEIAIQAPGYETCLFYVQVDLGGGSNAFKNISWRNCQSVSSGFSSNRLQLEARVGLTPIRSIQAVQEIQTDEKKAEKASVGDSAEIDKVEREHEIPEDVIAKNGRRDDKIIGSPEAEGPGNTKPVSKKRAGEVAGSSDGTAGGKNEKSAKADRPAAVRVDSDEIEISVSTNAGADIVVGGERVHLPSTMKARKGAEFEIIPAVKGRQKGIPYRGTIGQSEVSVQFCEASIRINESYVPGDPAPYQLSDIVLNGQQIASKTDNLSLVLPCQTYTVDAYIRENGVVLSAHQKIAVQSGKKNVYSLTLHVE